MIKINFKNDSYELRNEVFEWTIGEFESMSAILNNKDKDHLEKWIEVFELLKIPTEVIDNMDAFDFMEIIKEFNMFGVQNNEIVKTIHLKGEQYHAYDEKFRITVKEMKLIESLVNKNPDRYLGDIMAVIYKRPDIDPELHKDKAHIHFKAELIRKEASADMAIPILTFLSKKLIKDESVLNG